MPETELPAAPRLVVTAPADQAGQVLALDKTHLVVGRSDTADLTLPEHYISERHALLSTDATGAVTVTDLNSTNGTQVNGQAVTGPVTLKDGDTVAFSELVTRFDAAGVALPPTIYTVTGPVTA
jgi:pSer/pThr/pTyr-binding forkhead associated (FHA) protein